MSAGRSSIQGSNSNREPAEKLVLERVSFQVDEGEIFGITGRAASGKSTLLRILSGQLQPDQGEIRIFGKDLIRQPAHTLRLMNRISVDASFFKRLSPIENLLQAFSHIKHDEGFREQVVQTLLELGLESWMIFCPMEDLEKDAQQIVSLAAAFLANSRILLLDEPTHHLDWTARCRFYRKIFDLSRVRGTTVLFSSQDYNEVMGLSDRAIKLDGGHAVHCELGRQCELDSQDLDRISADEPIIANTQIGG